MNIFLLLSGLLMIALTVMPLVRTSAWWVRIFDFPRLQIFTVSAAILAALLWYGGDSPGWWLMVSALSACVIYQGARIYPYTLLAKKEVPSADATESQNSLSILVANVYMENRDAESLISIIDQNSPDIILVVETNARWQKALEKYEHSHPYTVYRPQDDTYGMHLYSRLELKDPEVRFLIQNDVPSILAKVRLPGGKEVQLFCLHPPPPFPTEAESSEERDTELAVVARELHNQNEPVIVCGDLNDVAWSRTNYQFQKATGLADPRVGRGFYNSFHAKLALIRFPLDHFFLSRHFSLLDFRRLPYFGSDHFPVYIKVSYRKLDESS